MSMMINPSGGGQIIAAGQPFKLRLRKKKPDGEDPPQASADTADDDPDITSDDESDETGDNR